MQYSNDILENCHGYAVETQFARWTDGTCSICGHAGLADFQCDAHANESWLQSAVCLVVSSSLVYGCDCTWFGQEANALSQKAFRWRRVSKPTANAREHAQALHQNRFAHLHVFWLRETYTQNMLCFIVVRNRFSTIDFVYKIQRTIALLLDVLLTMFL